MNAHESISTPTAPLLVKADPNAPALIVTGAETISIKSGTSFAGRNFDTDTRVLLPEKLEIGGDYYVSLDDDGCPHAELAQGSPQSSDFAGFHFAPGGNAQARSGGDDIPAINPHSCWDLNFRPACADPSGMTCAVLPDGTKFWYDIYKLNRDHIANGTSAFGAIIANGVATPKNLNGKGYFKKLDYETAVTVMAHHGKQLLSYDEFRIAAFGVTENSVAPKQPKLTGLDAARTSATGGMQMTGNLWDWGRDGDPDKPRASLFGGSWLCGGDAGSRCAYVAYDWPDLSGGNIGARGRSDHLQLA